MGHSPVNIRLQVSSAHDTGIVRRLLQHVAEKVADQYRRAADAKRAGVRMGSGKLWTEMSDSITTHVISDTEAVVTVDHRAAMQKQYGGLQVPGRQVKGGGLLMGAKFIPIGVNDAKGVAARDYPNKKLIFVPIKSFREKRAEIEDRAKERYGRDRFDPPGAYRERRRLRRYGNRRAGTIGARNEPSGFLIDPKAPEGDRVRFLLFSSIFVSDSEADKWFPNDGKVRQTASAALAEVKT